MAMAARQFINLDDQESAFFTRQLEYVRAKTYDIKYPEIIARQLIPVDYTVPNGAETVVYYVYDQQGLAKIVANYSDDIPRVDSRATRTVANIRSAVDAYGYSIQDIRAAKQAGADLPGRKAAVAKRAMLQLEQNVAFTGDDSYNLTGFFNHPNITDIASPADGAAGASLWSAKTYDKILRDLNLAVNTILDLTNGVERPNTVLLPIDQHNILSTTFLPNTSQNLLSTYLANSPYITSIVPVPNLKGAGAAGSDMLIAYRRDPDALQLVVPQDFEQLPVQERNLEYITPCHMRIGGVQIYYPLSVSKMDGI